MQRPEVTHQEVLNRNGTVIHFGTPVLSKTLVGIKQSPPGDFPEADEYLSNNIPTEDVRGLPF